MLLNELDTNDSRNYLNPSTRYPFDRPGDGFPSNPVDYGRVEVASGWWNPFQLSYLKTIHAEWQQLYDGYCSGNSVEGKLWATGPPPAWGDTPVPLPPDSYSLGGNLGGVRSSPGDVHRSYGE